MFNFEREWVLMEQHRHEQVRQACAARLKEEALRDQVSLISRLLMRTSRFLINIGASLNTLGATSAEKPHQYISAPQDRVYN